MEERDAAVRPPWRTPTHTRTRPPLDILNCFPLCTPPSNMSLTPPKSFSERERERDREREMFYLTTHSTHFIYGYMASDIWLRTILIVRKETCCRHIGYSYRVTARFLLYAPSHRQHNTYHSLCYIRVAWSAGWNEKLLNGSTL